MNNVVTVDFFPLVIGHNTIEYGKITLNNGMTRARLEI